MTPYLLICCAHTQVHIYIYHLFLQPPPSGSSLFSEIFSTMNTDPGPKISKIILRGTYTNTRFRFVKSFFVGVGVP